MGNEIKITKNNPPVLAGFARKVLYNEEQRGSYLLFFQHGRMLAIDATEDDGSTINHSRQSPNVVMKTHVVEGKPRVVFVACKEIKIGEEITYDYGEKRKAFLDRNPWLRS